MEINEDDEVSDCAFARLCMDVLFLSGRPLSLTSSMTGVRAADEAIRMLDPQRDTGT